MQTEFVTKSEKVYHKNNFGRDFQPLERRKSTLIVLGITTIAKINLIAVPHKLRMFDEIRGGAMWAIQVCNLSFHYKLNKQNSFRRKISRAESQKQRLKLKVN
jgi:hypothetical protein